MSNLRETLAEIADHLDCPEHAAWRKALADAAAVLEASRDGRLDRCRDRASRIVAGYDVDQRSESNIADCVEDLAHALLAAERAS